MELRLAEFDAPLTRMTVDLQNIKDNLNGKPTCLQYLMCAYFLDSLHKKCSSSLVIGYDQATLFQASQGK